MAGGASCSKIMPACKRRRPRYRAGSSVLKNKGWRVWTRVTKVVNRAWRLRWCKPASRAIRSRSLPMVPRIGRAGRWRKRWGSASRPCSGCGRQARLKPHRLDRYMASNDPRFEEKAADIIGLYMNPPQHAACFASMRRRRFRPLTDSIQCCRCRRDAPSGMALSTCRYGTLSLYAALDVKTGWCTA